MQMLPRNIFLGQQARRFFLSPNQSNDDDTDMQIFPHRYHGSDIQPKFKPVKSANMF